MNATLSWGHCATHGEVLIGYLGRCTRCEPKRPTVAAPRAPRQQRRRLGRPQAQQGIAGFTPCERRVADLLALGLRQIDIRTQLGLTHNQVVSAVRRCKRRIGVATEAELVRHLHHAMVGWSASANKDFPAAPVVGNKEVSV